jgi:isopropylmalate/homocitrate/citramalate synthase
MPIFKDTEELFKNIDDNVNKYILVPNQKQLIKALNFGATNFSFITSLSDSFQYKNTKLTKHENLNNINNMKDFLQDYSNIKIDIQNVNTIKKFYNFKVKLYVSCINECPIEGKISNDIIVSELYNLSNNFTKICLADTCGTLKNSDFTYIIGKLYKLGVNIKHFTLHLHIKPDMEYESEEIFHTALDYGIEEFDVSNLKSGGCSVTMNKNRFAPNMSYEQYYKFLTNYLIK